MVVTSQSAVCTAVCTAVTVASRCFEVHTLSCMPIRMLNSPALEELSVEGRSLVGKLCHLLPCHHFGGAPGGRQVKGR